MIGNNIKFCTRCGEAKDGDVDFYFCQGKVRGECKACTIKKNVLYQQRTKAWKYRYVDNDEKRSYMLEYYSKNKDKFAEYRRKFKENNPDYYKNYARDRKNKRPIDDL